MKGKSAIHIARAYMGRRKNLIDKQFLARVYYLSTVGMDEDAARAYIKKQEQEDQRFLSN